MKKCPFCAEEIQDEAVVCRFCGRDIGEPLIPKETEVESKEKPKLGAALWFILGLIAVIVIICLASSGGAGSSSSSSSKSSWNCTEYDSPYEIVFIDGEADVYGGVDEPSSSVKGHITGGAGGIEARCSKTGKSYYRLQGVDWWGWVKISDTYK